MKFNLPSIVAYLVAFSRWISSLFPESAEVTGDEVAAIKQRCRDSYRKWGHCENPFPVNHPLRRGLWVDETCNLVRETLGRAIRDPEYLTADCVREITGDDDWDRESIPPAPVPEEEAEEELPQAARLIEWNGEYVHV